MSKDKAGSMLDEMIALAGWRDAHRHVLSSLSRSLKTQFRAVVSAMGRTLVTVSEPEAMFAAYSDLSARAKLLAQTADYLAATTAVLIDRERLDAMLSAGEGESAPEPKAQTEEAPAAEPPPVSNYGKADPSRFVPIGEAPLEEVPDDPMPVAMDDPLFDLKGRKFTKTVEAADGPHEVELQDASEIEYDDEAAKKQGWQPPEPSGEAADVPFDPENPQ